MSQKVGSRPTHFKGCPFSPAASEGDEEARSTPAAAMTAPQRVDGVEDGVMDRYLPERSRHAAYRQKTAGSLFFLQSLS